jgi:hypothetical protein
MFGCGKKVIKKLRKGDGPQLFRTRIDTSMKRKRRCNHPTRIKD